MGITNIRAQVWFGHGSAVCTNTFIPNCLTVDNRVGALQTDKQKIFKPIKVKMRTSLGSVCCLLKFITPSKLAKWTFIKRYL